MTLRTSLALPTLLALLSLAACGPTPPLPHDADPGDVIAVDASDVLTPPSDSRTERIADRSVVAWVSPEADEPWWIEERIAPQPSAPGDRELGPRSIVRAAPDRRVVWQPPASDRLTDACRHPSGEWTAVGVDGDRRVFLARGDALGLRDRILLDDPELAHDPRAWGSTPRTVPRVWQLSESGVRVAADSEDVVVALMTEDDAVLAYRYARRAGAFVRGARTLVSPATPRSVFIPIGGSYDDFDAVTAPYVVHLGIDRRGRAFVAQFADRGRLTAHNAAMGTRLDLLRAQLYPRENTLDVLVSGVDRDGRVAFATVVGTPDVEDEVFGLAVGDERVAVLGRHRRELGRDNTELHVMVAELRADDGAALGATSVDVLDSGLAQAGAYHGDDLWIGGTEGWVQNPTGRSVWGEGQPFLLRLVRAAAGTGRIVQRADAYLPPTRGHAELRALGVQPAREGVAARLFLGGHENGPQTHTGDSDRSLIRSDAWWRFAPLPR